MKKVFFTGFKIIRWFTVVLVIFFTTVLFLQNIGFLASSQDTALIWWMFIRNMLLCVFAMILIGETIRFFREKDFKQTTINRDDKVYIWFLAFGLGIIFGIILLVQRKKIWDLVDTHPKWAYAAKMLADISRTLLLLTFSFLLAKVLADLLIIFSKMFEGLWLGIPETGTEPLLR